MSNILYMILQASLHGGRGSKVSWAKCYVYWS